jgi:hypothetical protein
MNTVTASLDRKDFSKVQTSTLLNTMIQEFKFRPQNLQMKKLSTPSEVLLSTKKKENTPIRSRKKNLKKSTDSLSQSQSTESSSQPATNTSTSSVENEKKQKKITQKIEENLVEIGLKFYFKFSRKVAILSF